MKKFAKNLWLIKPELQATVNYTGHGESTAKRLLNL
jgi:hypothetical protein